MAAFSMMMMMTASLPIIIHSYVAATSDKEQ